MKDRSLSPLLAPFALLLTMGLAPIPGAAQEIPLKHCGKLPVIEVEVASQSMLFLVDTAATSFLDLKSFAEGKMRDIEITSWKGTLATNAKEVTLKEVVIGNTKLVPLKLPPVDLSAIGKACRRKMHGILDVDLPAKMAQTISFQSQIS